MEREKNRIKELLVGRGACMKRGRANRKEGENTSTESLKRRSCNVNRKKDV